MSRLYTTNRGVFHEFFGLFGQIVHSDLARQIEYLKVENQLLRKRAGKRIRLTLSEQRRIVKFGLPLGRDLRRVISIVAYPTFRRWLKKKPIVAQQN